MTKTVDVAAAILLRKGENGPEYLLACRPEGKVYAGYWEFPGGKVEAGETLGEALVREIQEELGVTIDNAWPWLFREFTYPHARVRLKFFRVSSWHGEITVIEHSGIVWTKIGDTPTVTPVLPANGPILRALALPSLYAITNAAENGIETELTRLKDALDSGLRLVQIRDKTLSRDERKRFTEDVLRLTQTYDNVCVLINDDATLVIETGAQGLHLSSAQLMRSSQRPAFDWVAASCHTPDELAHATLLGIDFAVLSPVLPTPTHPEAQGIGWESFKQTIEKSPIPVFALGGMNPETLETAWAHGGHGIAMMRGW